MTTYISLVAQHENLGDLVIRQLSLDWASDLGEPIHALVDSGASDYVASLAFPESVRLFSSRSRWYASLLREIIFGGRPNLVYAAGPQKLRWNKKTYLNGILGIVAHGLLFLGRGRVAKIGRSLDHDSPIGGLLEAQLLRQASYYSVRDAPSALTSASRFRTPRVAPDIGFSYPYQPSRGVDRNIVSFALRPTEGFDVGAVQRVVDDCLLAGFRCQVVVQVRNDSKLADLISQTCGIHLVPWSLDTTPLDQLDRVLLEYSQSAAVVTNRLHAAVFAAGMGAAPVAFEASTTAKVSRTLATAEVDCWAVTEFQPSRASQAAHTERIERQVQSAREQLEAERRLFLEAMTGAR